MSASLIKEIVEQHFKLDITTKTRKREYVEARGIYYYLTRQYTRMSLSSIGKTMGRDHSTVLHFEKLIPHWIIYDIQLKEDYNIINTFSKLKKNSLLSNFSEIKGKVINQFNLVLSKSLELKSGHNLFKKNNSV